MNKNLLSVAALLIIFSLWISPGLFGRDPWKADEPYTYGLVQHMVTTGDYVVPALAGEPFLEKPPIFFITAALFGKFFSPPLEILNAMRLASAFCMLLAVLFFALSARELFGKEHAAVAAILLMGCIHLQENVHKLITDVALFTGFSIALYGFTLCNRKKIAGGFWLGTGIGIGFLSKGLLPLGVLGLTAVALPVLFRAWRRKDYGVTLLVAFAAALPWLVIWPAALYGRSHPFFIEWFWTQNLGRFLGFGTAGGSGNDSHFFFLKNLVWLIWPATIPALLALWKFRTSWRIHPVYQMPLLVSIILLAALSASSTNRPLYALPLVLPMALIAIPGISLLPLKAKLWGNRFSVALFGCAALLLWFGWSAMMIGGPAGITRMLHDFQPDYVPSVNIVLLAIAALYTLAWIFIVTRITRSPEDVVVNWTLGVVLAWGLIMTLWLPALNAGSSYREAFTEMKKAMPGKYTCFASQGVGESERAMIEYFAGLRPQRVETRGKGDCDLVLEQRGGGNPVAMVEPGWEIIWEFKRPSNRPKDHFTLFRKVEPE